MAVEAEAFVGSKKRPMAMILIKASMMKRTLNGISESFTSLFLPWSASFVGSVRARKVQLRMMAEMIAASEAQKAAQEAKRRRAALAEAERREKRAEEVAEARARMSAAEYERTILDLRQKLQVSFALLPAALRKSR